MPHDRLVSSVAGKHGLPGAISLTVEAAHTQVGPVLGLFKPLSPY
jgi:hypothetical protein